MEKIPENDPNTTRNDQVPLVVTPPKNDVMRIREEEGETSSTNVIPQRTEGITTTTNDKASFANSYQINIILLLVACWYAVTLTDWGRISSTDQYVLTAANPSVGTVSMWIIIVSQWIMFLLYIWSLIAPRVFPYRDFD